MWCMFVYVYKCGACLYMWTSVVHVYICGPVWCMCYIGGPVWCMFVYMNKCGACFVKVD